MMKLSDNTLAVLKNFGTINSGIFFKKGKTVKTVSSHKNILAQATIPDEIPADFGIYDLNEFLSVVSLYKDDLDLQLENKDLVLSGKKGRSFTKYRTCDSTMVVAPPEKELQMPDAEITVELTAEDFKWILDAANVLSSPQIAIQSDGKNVSINTLDPSNDSAHTQSLDLDVEGNGNKYRMLFKTENIQKLLSGAYDLKISSKGISHFKNKKFPIEYWVTTEVGSTFDKAK
jgi:hypothetical protein